MVRERVCSVYIYRLECFGLQGTKCPANSDINRKDTGLLVSL